MFLRLLMKMISFFFNAVGIDYQHWRSPRGGTEPTTRDIYGGMLCELIRFSKLILEHLRKTIINTRICSFGSNIQIISHL